MDVTKMQMAFLIVGVLMFVFSMDSVKQRVSRFWEKHIERDFESTNYHPECFMCNEPESSCYKDPTRCAAMNLKQDEGGTWK